MQLENAKRFIVVGLGSSGLAAVRYLHSLGLEVSVSEFRPRQQLAAADMAVLEQLDVKLETGGHTWDFIRDADCIVPSPGVPLTLPVLERARAEGIVIAGELALAAGKFTVPVIGVTGSNGKTTVTSLIGHLLKAAGRKVFVGGNIGTPLLDYLRQGLEAEAVVLELSSFQLEISGDFRPDIALLLNISPDHLDRHGSVEKYGAAKRRIFVHQVKGDTAILGRDDMEVMKGGVPAAGTVLTFGCHPAAGALVTENGVLVSAAVPGIDAVEKYDLTHTRLHSAVNMLNAAAAILAARVFGCSSGAINKGLADYEPPKHRMALVREIEGVRYIDDSKATNVGAVAAALGSSGNSVVLIAGGRDKGSDFGLLRPYVEKHVKELVLLGEAADQMAAALGSLVPVHRVSGMKEAVELAAGIARPGYTVLLAPACASFDMFSSYAHRGEVFKEAVLNLREGKQVCAKEQV